MSGIEKLCTHRTSQPNAVVQSCMFTALLSAQVFDVCTGTNCLPTTMGDNIVRVPWGQGIIGHVAATGEPVNITRASQVSGVGGAGRWAGGATWRRRLGRAGVRAG